MKNHPLVSIITPLYNKRPYVKRAIESVQKQTYGNWELIIVDDGSTDGSSDEIPRNDPRIKLLRQENRGPGAARNRGAEIASGDFVAFIDADDSYYPFKLEKEMDLLWKGKRAEWMMSSYDYELNNVMSCHYIKDIHGNEIKEKTLVFDNALDQLTVAGWHVDGLFMKMDFFKRLNGFREDMRYGEITEFIIRCALMQPRVVICHIPLFHHIDVPESAAKVLSHRRDASRQMGEGFHILSKDYPEYSDYLTSRCRISLYSYVAELILLGKNTEARRYLLNKFPYGRDRKWWKMWFGSWMPNWLLNHLIQIKIRLISKIVD